MSSVQLRENQRAEAKAMQHWHKGTLQQMCSLDVMGGLDMRVVL